MNRRLQIIPIGDVVESPSISQSSYEHVLTAYMFPGIMTGKCVPPDRPVSGNYNVCEIYSWCPVEYDRLPMPGTNFGKPLKK